MDYSTTTHPPRFHVTVEGERFTCEEAQGLIPGTAAAPPTAATSR